MLLDLVDVTTCGLTVLAHIDNIIILLETNVIEGDWALLEIGIRKIECLDQRWIDLGGSLLYILQESRLEGVSNLLVGPLEILSPQIMLRGNSHFWLINWVHVVFFIDII